jgi:hypothetical protein
MYGRVGIELTAFFVFTLNVRAELIKMVSMHSIVLSPCGLWRYNCIVW